MAAKSIAEDDISLTSQDKIIEKQHFSCFHKEKCRLFIDFEYD